MAKIKPSPERKPYGRIAWLMGTAVACVIAVLMSLRIHGPAESDVPAAPLHFLDDRAGLLSREFVSAKDQYIEYLSRTMRIAQVNIVIFARAPEADIEDFCIRAATAWKVGDGKADNGLVLFIFREDKKVRLEVGYGLESVVTDSVANNLLTAQLVPAFERGQFEAGIDGFLSSLNKLLESSEAAHQRAAPQMTLVPFVINVVRASPRIARQGWRAFLREDTQSRIVLSIFAVVLGAALLNAMLGVSAGIPSMLMLPWRIYTSQKLRQLGAPEVRDQFKPRNFWARPPPILKEVFLKLQLGPTMSAIYQLAGITVGIAFLFVGSSILIGGLGHFGGAGATVAWQVH